MGYQIKKEVVEQEVHTIVGVICDGCGEPNKIYNYSIDDGLHVIIDGGYGMYFDIPSFTCVICKKCADKMFEIFPNFKKVIFEGEGDTTSHAE